MSFFNAVCVRYGRRLVNSKELASRIVACLRHMNPPLQLAMTAMLVVMSYSIRAKAQICGSSVVPNILVTGNGTQTTSFAAAAGFPTMSASAQISMNTGNTGNNRGAALDLYTGSSGIPLRIWADDSNYTGGKEISTIIGAGIVTRDSLVVSGNVSRYSGNPFNATILTPTPDPAMIEVWSDVNAPALVVSPNPGSFSGSAGNPGYQAAVLWMGEMSGLPSTRPALCSGHHLCLIPSSDHTGTRHLAELRQGCLRLKPCSSAHCW
jgi:hypothetical protein